MALGYLCLIVVGITVANGQFLNCNWVNNLNCAAYTPEVICASDGKDYPNRCSLAKAQCADSTLRTVTTGTCGSNAVTGATSGPIVASTNVAPTSGVVNTQIPTGTTTPRDPVFINHNQLLDFFCLELMHETCPTNTEKVCGSDGVTYANFCEYEKKRCGHRDIQVNHFGDC